MREQKLSLLVSFTASFAPRQCRHFIYVKPWEANSHRCDRFDRFVRAALLLLLAGAGQRATTNSTAASTHNTQLGSKRGGESAPREPQQAPLLPPQTNTRTKVTRQ